MTRRKGSSAQFRRKMVRDLQKAGHLKSDGVASAFLEVPRETFIPDAADSEGLPAVYSNRAFVTKKDARGLPVSSSSEPAIMARMLELLDLAPGMRVLEIGAGTGYNAALLKCLVGDRGRVITIDVDPETATGARAGLRRARYAARVVSGDGWQGWKKAAPYDRIIVTASHTEVSKRWFDQIRPLGILVMPLRLHEDLFWPQVVLALRREGSGFTGVRAITGGFMGMRSSPDDPSPLEGFDGQTLGSWERMKESRGLVRVSGSGLGTLSAAARRRLLAEMLSDPGRMKLGIDAPRHALELFLTMAAGPREVVSVRLPRMKGSRVAVLSRDPPGCALLRGGSRVREVDVYGSMAAFDLLRSLAGAWVALGRPGLRRLKVGVWFDVKRRGDHWKALKRSQCRLGFDWAELDSADHG
jgi:protein-L-isoaspartate(D-aspartate) O-methyltransferase